MSDSISFNEMKAAVREVLDERIDASRGLCSKCCQVCQLTPQEHSEHHRAIAMIGIGEMIECHRAFQAAAKDRREVKRWMFRLLVGAVMISASTFIGAALWHYFRHRLSLNDP